MEPLAEHAVSARLIENLGVPLGRRYHSAMQNDPASLAEQLMQIDSTSGREGAAIDWLDDALSKSGWSTTRIPVTEGRSALYARSAPLCPVTLSTHVDTVPPFVTPRRDQRRLYGRGACDAKGIAASMVVAAERCRAKGHSVGLLFVVGEEVSHDGAHAANAWARANRPGSRVLINGEPTDNALAIGTKGAVRVVVRTAGQAAHSAYPHLGKSATMDLVRMLAEIDDLELPSDELLGATTVNIGSLGGGVADNVVAPAAEARLMIRLVSPLDEIRAIVERWAAGRATLEWGVSVPAMRLGRIDGFETSVAAFATDI